MIQNELVQHAKILADQLISYKAYPSNAPLFHINEVNSILLEMLNDEEDKESLIFIRNALMRFQFYSQLKQGEGPNES